MCTCLAGVALVAAAHFAVPVVDIDKGKMGANRIVSPWDKSAAPPLLRPSRVVGTPEPAETHRPRHTKHHFASKSGAPEPTTYTASTNR